MKLLPRLLVVLAVAAVFGLIHRDPVMRVERVQATIAKKTPRMIGKRVRQNLVEVYYKSYVASIDDYTAYHNKQIGDPYEACLVTYHDCNTDKPYSVLEACPESD
jgi:hypothetical protein